MIAKKSSTWQLQEAKNKLSEVVRRTREEGPQTITVRGEDAVVMVTAEVYQAYLAGQPEASVPRESLSEFFQRWAKETGGVELDLSYEMPEAPMREIDFGD